MESEREIHITYETLVDISRRERNKPELQRLEKTFYADVLEYLLEKKRILNEITKNSGGFQGQEQKAAFQLNNAKKLIRDIYERRERKIISMALNRSRTGSDIIDTSTLLEEEKKLYDALVNTFDDFRSRILANILDLRPPEENKRQGMVAESRDEGTPVRTEGKNENGSGEKNPSSGKEFVLVRFLHAVPKFVGTDLSAYGPFDEEDIAKLPADVARVLIAKGRAEEMHERE